MATADTPKPGPAKAAPAADNPPADSAADDLFTRAQAKAPSLTREYVTAVGIPDEMLEGIAAGLIPPPPMPGPVRNTDMHLTPSGWQQTPHGVKPEDVGSDAISR